MFNKKQGQVGETATWLVATVIIVVILSVSIFVSTIGPWGKKDVPLSDDVDYLTSKSFFAYALTEEEGATIHNSFKEEGDFTDFNGELALRIFEDFYGDEYGYVWFGLVTKEFPVQTSSRNEYFGRRDVTAGDFGLRGSIFDRKIVPVLTESVHIEGNKSLELSLVPRD